MANPSTGTHPVKYSATPLSKRWVSQISTLLAKLADAAGKADK
jgi:hypothetical protein